MRLEAEAWFQGRIWMVWRVVTLQDTRETLPARRGTVGDVWDGARVHRGSTSNYPVSTSNYAVGTVRPDFGGVERSIFRVWYGI